MKQVFHFNLYREFFADIHAVAAAVLALNLEVAANIEKGETVISPGVPRDYPDPKKLVTKDCIEPAEAKP